MAGELINKPLVCQSASICLNCEHLDEDENDLKYNGEAVLCKGKLLLHITKMHRRTFEICIQNFNWQKVEHFH